uniref:AT hook containing transcription factor 1 n=1 Tax=Cyclopterus lumpus TaxID=8103 RepID=A0A8C2WPW1_CYCLU
SCVLLKNGTYGLAWLACGPHLEVVHAVTGERLSAYCFSGGGEHPPSVHAARDFGWLKRSGLLVGLEEAEGSVLCLYDLGLSKVVKAVVIPGRITAIEPLVSYGGASTSTQHLHQSLRWFFGIAAVVTDLGHVLLVDLCLDDLTCSQSELESSDLQVVTKSPAEIPRLREVSTRQGRHLCLQLKGPSGVGATALQYISRTNQLAVGFSDGHLHLWNMKTLKKEYHSQLEGGRVPVHAFTFQEPENDPRNCCYLWAVQSSQDLEGDMVSLRLLQMAFSERKCLPSGKILYEGLEYCEERYSQELSGSAFPLRNQATNTRLLSCQTIEKFRPHPDRDESMNEVASPDTSVSIFSWQVKAYGQGTLSTYIGVFDINRWYHAQMPDSLRTGETLQNCPYLAVWSLDPVVQMVSQHVLLDVVVHDRSLSRGLPFTCPPPEQYFNPTTYNFDATCLLNSGIVHSTCSGYQKETLSFLKKAAPCSSDIISTSYSRCLMSGLLSSRLADTQASSLSQEEQLDAILSTAVETSSLGLITGCIKQWTAEEQPGSALNLRYILDWAWNKVVGTKQELDGICAPLFDSSSNFTDPQTMQLLQHSQRMLSNLSTIFHCLLSEAQELTQKGLVGLMNKNLVSSLISKYAQVVLWFCRTGLLPEGSDDNALQISRPFYTHSIISNYYAIRREELTRLSKGKWCSDCLMIDGLVGQCGERLTNLWKRDAGGTGQYPPPTLHALLDIYLLDNIEEAVKNAIVIYLLLDVMYSFPNKEGASVESFPPAFGIPIGLVKLVQGLWLLDHHDHQSSFELLLHPATSRCQFDWQHERVLQALMCQGQHSVALRYFHVTKPPISSTSKAKLCLSVLLHNRCLVEAWSLLRQHSNRLNMGELLGFLYESCQELCLIKELLKLPLGLTEQESLEKFLQGTGGLQNRELLMVHYLQQANYIPALQLNHSLKMNLVNERDPKLKERSNTRNLILDQYGKVLPRVQRKLAMERAKPYQHPYAVHREVSRPQPLSTITKRSTSEKVMSRAGFINNVLTKIEEVWLGTGATPTSSPAKSHRAADFQSPKSSMAFSDPFLGTPITMTSKRKSRLMDLVVHPSCQTPRPLLSPVRPLSSWVSPKSISKAPELSLLQTPQVVKRARALAASGPVFSAFTPQSILRSSLRPTPVATPSASPGRSITPPLRSKESRITFIEEAESPEPEKGIRWTNGIVEEDMEGEVVMVRLGADEEGMEANEEEEQGSSYSTTILVPLQLVEGQDGLVDSSQLGLPELQQTILPDDPRSETHSGFSLMLDIDDDRNEEGDTLPMENDLQSSNPPPLSPAVEAIEEFVAKPEVILLGTDDQDSPLSGEVSEEEQRKEMDTMDGIEVDGSTESELAKLADIQTENTETNHEAEDAEERSDAKYVTLVEVHEPEDREPESLSTSGPGSMEEVQAEMLTDDQEPEGLSTSGATDDKEPEGLSTSGPSSVGEVPAEMLADDQEPEGLSTFGPSSVGEVPAAMLADDQEPEGLSTSGPSSVGEVPAEMLADDEEPEGLSTSGPSPVGEVPAEMLADDEEPEGLSVSRPSPVGEVPAEMLADDQEPESLSVSGPTPVGELPAEILADDPEPEGLSNSGPSAVGEVPTEMLADDQEPEGFSTSGPSSVGEVPSEMLADDQEPEGLSTSGLTPVGELPAEMLAYDKEPEGLSNSGPSPVGEVPTEMLADGQEPEGFSASGPSSVGELPAEMLADDQEHESLSVTGPTPVGELPAVVDEKDASSEKHTTAEEEKMGKEDKCAVDQEENGDVNMDTDVTETATVMEEKQQDHKSLAETGEDNGEEIKLENETRRRTRGRQSKDNGKEEFVKQISQTEEQPVLETPTSQTKMKAPSTPTRRTTRGRTVTFISPLLEEAEELEEEVETSTFLPASPRRTPRKRKQNKETQVQASTPRRSTRNAQLEPPNYKVDEWDTLDIDTTFASTSKASSPARRLVSQRATSTRTSKRTPSEDDEEQQAVVKDTIVSRRTSSKTPTPAKRRTTQENTPRRSSRKTLSSIEVVLTPFETLEDEKEQVEVFDSPVKRNSRKGQTESSETQPSMLDEEERKTPSSPGRSARKIRGTITENVKESGVLLEPELNSNNSHRPTRSKLWDHPEEDLPLLDSPLEVDSETPVADALIKRLKDEDEKNEVVTKMVRTSKRSTKSSVEEVHSLLPLKDSLVPEPEESSPGEHSFIYSPSRRKTRGEHVIHLPVSTKEVTPCSGLVFLFTFRSKAVLESPPITEVDLISPLPSPAEPLPLALKRIIEGEAPTSSFNLRRKRIMETVFTKPVTRRKKL